MTIATYVVIVYYYYYYYLLTPWSRVLLDKLIVTKLVKKFPTFYGTQRFITAFSTLRQIHGLV
jgi:hypothetical protein